MSSAREVYTRTVTGRNLIAGAERAGGEAWHGVSPRTGQALPVPFYEATREEVLDAVRAAADALVERWVPGRDVLATLLQAAADELEAAAADLVALVDHETALGETRARRELERTVGQFRFFAREVADGSHVEATITRPDPDAPGVPRPDLRRLLLPVGPVGVFGASNFPLAFSVPGGDTASALAAGCPVVAKGHPAHPGTSERCARALAAAVAAAGLPPAWCSLVQGRGTEVGEWLVTAPELAAVGFTGSLQGGRALHDVAAARERPIPVYAEMGSLNPVFVTAAALRARTEQIADALVGTVVTNAGQLCTKPGVVFVPDGPESEAFADAVAERIATGDAGPLLSAGVRERLEERLRDSEQSPGVTVLARGEQPGDWPWAVPATVLQCGLETFLARPALAEEHFGPVAVVVSCGGEDDLVEAARRFEGTLTATVHAEDGDEAVVAELSAVAARGAGRIVYNGVPTGLAVAHATTHGGPYPATTSPLHTSVGSAATRRFLRPVAYQAMPDHLLPPALQDANPLDLLRNVDGEWTRAPLGASV